MAKIPSKTAPFPDSSDVEVKGVEAGFFGSWCVRLDLGLTAERAALASSPPPPPHLGSHFCSLTVRAGTLRA